MEAEVLRTVIKPETDLELFLIAQPEVQAGMAWGVPRFGHPEGEVYRHVREVLDNVDRLPNINAEHRRDLRLVTMLHDTWKYTEDKRKPRDWSKHHGRLARAFAKTYIQRTRVLDLIEWHDEAYYCWRLEALHRRPSKARQRFDALLNLFEDQIDFYYHFFICDTRTGDKNLAPIAWFERESGVNPVRW